MVSQVSKDTVSASSDGWVSHDPRYGGGYRPCDADLVVEVSDTRKENVRVDRAGDIFWGYGSDCEHPVWFWRPVNPQPHKPQSGASSEAVERLEALARAATPGRWRVSEDNNPFADGRHVFAVGLDGSDFVVLNLKTDQTFVTATTREQQQRNALFSAAANPETILALISTLRSQAEALENIAYLAVEQVGVPVDTESASSWALSFQAATDIARAALTPEVSK